MSVRCPRGYQHRFPTDNTADILTTAACDIQEVAPGLKDAMLENYTVMVGLYSRLGVAPGEALTLPPLYVVI